MERRLAAIISTDVVGYSRLIRTDEEGTLADLKALRADLIDPKPAKHHGRIVKLMGDGMLAEFPSVVDAVRAAVETQQAVAERNANVPEDKRIEFRVGINLGDVVIDGDDIQGDGVNVAARLEGLAKPGGICISGMVYEGVRDHTDLVFEDLGDQEVKNIDRPVRVWQWVTDAGLAVSVSAKMDELLPLPHRPSIAVLPFINISSDPEQNFFADGVVEDLITALSRFRWLDVVARNSSFSFKDKNVQIRDVAKTLGVSYVVEGSVRSSASRLRVTVQLIDAVKDNHIWAENYDRQPGDLFDLQDEITSTIVGVLVPALGAVERERSIRTSRPGLGAWEAYQRGLAYYYRPFSVEDNLEAKRLFGLAIEKDPQFSDAHAMLAMMAIYAVNSGQSTFTESRSEVLAEANRLAQKATQLDDGNALGHIALGRVNDLLGNIDTAIAECKTAVRLNPNLALAHHELGMALSHSDQLEDSIEYLDEAIRLSPNDPGRWNVFLIKGRVLFSIGLYEESIEALIEASRLRPTAFLHSYCSPHLTLAQETW